jgi:hypothetical protein
MASNSISISELVIKGQNHYRGNIVSLFAAKADGFAHELDIEGILEPEPTNAHDPNAVILRVHGYAIGYVAQQFAPSVKSQIGSGIKVGCKLLWNRDPEAPMISVVVTSIDF